MSTAKSAASTSHVSVNYDADADPCIYLSETSTLASHWNKCTMPITKQRSAEVLAHVFLFCSNLAICPVQKKHFALEVCVRETTNPRRFAVNL